MTTKPREVSVSSPPFRPAPPGRRSPTRTNVRVRARRPADPHPVFPASPPGGYCQLAYSGLPSAYPAALCTPTTARSANSASEAAPA